MNVKKLFKILNVALILMVLAMVVASFVCPAFATLTPTDIKAEDPQGDSIQTIGQRVIGILRTVGVVLSVVVLIVIGIKYMMGSPEEKSEYKSSMLPYIIGAALIFAASIFAQTVYDFFTGLGK